MELVVECVWMEVREGLLATVNIDVQFQILLNGDRRDVGAVGIKSILLCTDR